MKFFGGKLSEKAIHAAAFYVKPASKFVIRFSCFNERTVPLFRSIYQSIVETFLKYVPTLTRPFSYSLMLSCCVKELLFSFDHC